MPLKKTTLLLEIIVTFFHFYVLEKSVTFPIKVINMSQLFIITTFYLEWWNYEVNFGT